MIKLFFLSLILFLGCSEQKVVKNYDAKELIQTKCASCHNLDIPPTLSDDESAPPMMAVAFHISSLIEVNNESQRVPKSVAFVVDYVLKPSREKSFCDKKSLEQYGLMPSQKKNVTKEELDAIARYMFKHYTQENLTKVQEQQKRLNALPTGEKLALQYRCFACHKIDKKIIGPSFNDIAKRYSDDLQRVKNSITNGSKKHWESSKGAIMPKFDKIAKEDLELLSLWILGLNP